MSGRPGLSTYVLIVMGVSGAGKSTLAEDLAEALHWPLQEGDALHPPSNIQKMHAGIALTDEDRAPWLAAIKSWIDARLAAGENGLVTCSALKRAYRDLLIAGRPNVRTLYLKADPAVLRERVLHRHGHFMPASLLESQLHTLEEPLPEEHALIVGMEGTPDQNLAAALAAIRRIGGTVPVPPNPPSLPGPP
jgi:carbohydrate kinase (thermoresistant glucokinase family)